MGCGGACACELVCNFLEGQGMVVARVGWLTVVTGLRCLLGVQRLAHCVLGPCRRA